MSYVSSHMSTKKPRDVAMTTITVLGLLLLVLLTAVVISWVTISFDRFTSTELTPGMEYEVAGRKYVFPNIKVEGKCLKLKDEVIEDLRDLMQRTHTLLNELGIPYHVSGGSLLGAIRNKTVPMVWDDDLDIHTDLQFREYLFSENFRAKANEAGLETAFLAGVTLQKADRHSSAVRLFLKEKGISSGTLDIFFLQRQGDKVVKIDSWLNNTFVPNAKEQFNQRDVYPRRLITVDGIELYMPANGTNLLHQQYGKSVLECAKIAPRVGSHKFAFQFLQELWKSTPFPGL